MEGRVCENVLYPTLSAVIDADTGYVQWQVSEDAGTTWMDIAGATNRNYRSDQLSPNTYLFRYLYANSQSNLQNGKCRIVSASKSLEVVPVYYTIIDTLCEGLGFILGNETYSSSGTYMQELQALNGCDSIVTLHLQIVPDPGIQATLITTPPLCTGAANATISVQSVQNGTPEYILAAQSYSPVSIHQPLLVTAGEYFVTITDRYGCTFSDAVRIEDPELFIIDLTGDSTTYVGHPVNLHVSGNYTVASLEFNPSEGLVCSSCTSTSASPAYTILYTATAVSPNGCIASDSLLIRVDTDPRIYIPNVFSPNGDALNDAWIAAADPLNIKEIESIRVFDRWGNILLDSAKLQPEETMVLWNANAARDLTTGVYTYLIEIRLANDLVTHKGGTVTVIK
jgi:gliding motility-associated-like protein